MAAAELAYVKLTVGGKPHPPLGGVFPSPKGGTFFAACGGGSYHTIQFFHQTVLPLLRRYITTYLARE